jgi:hypothetical protein
MTTVKLVNDSIVFSMHSNSHRIMKFLKLFRFMLDLYLFKELIHISIVYLFVIVFFLTLNINLTFHITLRYYWSINNKERTHKIQRQSSIN